VQGRVAPSYNDGWEPDLTVGATNFETSSFRNSVSCVKIPIPDHAGNIPLLNHVDRILIHATDLLEFDVAWI